MAQLRSEAEYLNQRLVGSIVCKENYMGSSQSTVEKSANSTDASSNQTAKILLARKLNELIDHRGWNQSEVAGITGMTQPKVSQVRRCQLQNISLERLMQALVALGQRVEIVVRPSSRTGASGITVVQR